MTAVDLHPEDLLDRDARGQLSPDERARLQTHLDLCAVCRFERRVRDDLRVETEGYPEVDVRRLVAAALTPESLRQADPARERAPLRRRSRVPRAALLVAALVTIAGVSTAAVLSGLRSNVSHRDRVIETEGVTASSASAGAARRPMAANLPPVGPAIAASAASAMDPSAAPSEPEAPAPVAAPEPSHAPATSLSPVSLVSPLPAPRGPRAYAVARSASPIDAPRADVDPPADAPSLFAAATRARRAGDRAAAVASYRTLLRSYPDTAEGRQALVALGKMLLDSGDAAGALRCFDEYLRVGGPLREDVMADRAVALQRLGRPADETAAWSALLAAYPASVHADRARRRVAELEAR
jgi:TolA-binding protein